jgi:short-subunit dehydrogenase
VPSAQPYVALITGASSGIGEATARRLAREPGAKLVLVARRKERLDQLAQELSDPPSTPAATVVAVDLTEPDAPAAVLEAVARVHGELHLLVNNAGARWGGEFADTGWENVERHMKIDFEAPVRLTGELLPLLRATASRASRPVSIVNVSSTSGRVARRGAGGYSAAKFALAGWSDSLAAEEARHGVHVGLVLPGYVATEGFPQAELVAHPLLRRIVSGPEVVAEAIVECALSGKTERYAPRPYWLAAAARILAPRLVRRLTAGETFTPATGSDGPG